MGIEHVPTIVDMRRNLVDEGELDPLLQQTLENYGKQGNSYGKSARMRARWAKGLDFKIPDARKEPVEYVWFVGDFASFDERVQVASRTVARILHDAGVSFGLLYEGERNSGNDVRRIGEEGLFEMLVEQNMGALAEAGSRRSSPPTLTRSTPCATSIRSSASTSRSTTTPSCSPISSRAARSRCARRCRGRASRTTTRAISRATTASPRRRAG